MFTRTLRYASFYLVGSQEYDLNVITNPEWVIAVLEEIEARGEEWHGAKQQVQEAKQAIQQRLAELPEYSPEYQKEAVEENRPVYTIYGAGGTDRYMVLFNGDVEASEFHFFKEKFEQAKALGMRAFE